ncbi:recombinase family protein [Methylorubrum extorquens]|uniref:Recombinase family protein n=1 Tax=Methylorubrum extorquens TaxID=408 RepID=A0AAX3WLS4_METEX|nr:recombinase family protein [Methylorubrum extorquens]
MVTGSKRLGRLRARTKVLQETKAARAPRAVGYLRVSTEEQAATGHGLDTQEKAVRAFAESQGYELVEVLTDAGVSGATKPTERPAFGRVVALAEAGALDVLLVAKIDRLSRDIRHAMTTVSDLAEQHEVAFRSVTESVIDTSNPMGRTFFAIFAGMAENERFVIRDRTAGGRVAKAGKGGFAGGKAPYGYEKDLQGGLRVVEDQAKVVRRIYRERRQRRTLQIITDGLNADRIPSPTGGEGRVSSVSYLLDNPKYRGAVEYLFRWSGAETHVLQPGSHEAIVG